MGAPGFCSLISSSRYRKRCPTTAARDGRALARSCGSTQARIARLASPSTDLSR
jgi:hypothetical protein